MDYLDLNNKILKNCKVALNLKDDDVYQIWNLGGLRLSRNAARNFFTGQHNKNYRKCSDDDILIFFDGLKLYLRDAKRFKE